MAEVAKMNKAGAAVDMATKVNDLLMNNPVTKMVEKMVKDTENHIKELEKNIADIETMTINRGIDLLKKSVVVAHDIRNFGIDWESKKTLWSKRAERYAKVLKKKNAKVSLQMAFVKALVDDIVKGSTEFMKRGRELQKEADSMSKEAKSLKEVMNKSSKSLIKAKEKAVEQQRLGHIAWAGAVVMPPFGLIPGIIATTVIEGFTVPQLKNKIKEVRERLENCDKIWEETVNVTEKLSKTLQTWIHEASQLKLQAEEFKEFYGDYVNPDFADVQEDFQEELIRVFEKLAATLKEYA